MTDTPLVQVRTPTYRRPEALRRALSSLRKQGWRNWICDVYDDDPAGSAQPVCAGLGDSRIRYHHNPTQLFASRNIDHCYSAANPHGAEYFCVLEDDNQLLPGFLEANIELCREAGVEIVLRNQLVEHESGTDRAWVGDEGVLDGLFVERTYAPEEFRLSLFAGIGVSNGGLFWTRHARSPLEIGYACTASMQEYMRTFSIREPIRVAMTPLAVWAENGGQTTRNADITSSYLRRELDLKRVIQRLQRLAWREASSEQRRRFLADPAFSADPALRARGLTKALIMHGGRGLLPPVEAAELASRGLAIALLGRTTPDFGHFVQSRLAGPGR